MRDETVPLHLPDPDGSSSFTSLDRLPQGEVHCPCGSYLKGTQRSLLINLRDEGHVGDGQKEQSKGKSYD